MDYQHLISEAVNSISTLLSRRIASQDSRLTKSAITLAYWLKDYVRLLGKELSASSYRRYDRGCVVSVHLGFRIGHEEGGLHYAIVLDKYDTTKNTVVTILPLTSMKENVDIEHLYFKHLFLGSEVTDAIYEKIRQSIDTLTEESECLNEEWAKLANEKTRDVSRIRAYEQKKKQIGEKILLAKKQLDKVAKMKSGSIALADQVLTVSKLRIYDPCTSKDLLHGIKLCSDTMDKIDGKLKQLYIG